MNKILVTPSSSSYPIYFSQNFDHILEALHHHNLLHRKVCIITDHTVDSYYGNQLMDVLKEVMMMCLNLFSKRRRKQASKHDSDMYKFFIENHLDRNS